MKIQYDEPVSNFAFIFNLRRYSEARIKSVVVRCKDRESTGQAVVKATHDQSCDGLCLGSRGLGATLQGALLSAVGPPSLAARSPFNTS